LTVDGSASKGTGSIRCEVEFCIFYRLSFRTLRTNVVVCVSGFQSAAPQLSSGVDTRDTLSWECQNVRDVKWKSVSETAVKLKLSLREFREELWPLSVAMLGWQFREELWPLSVAMLGWQFREELWPLSVAMFGWQFREELWPLSVAMLGWQFSVR
jgi:hypothetical protein